MAMVDKAAALLGHFAETRTSQAPDGCNRCPTMDSKRTLDDRVSTGFVNESNRQWLSIYSDAIVYSLKIESVAKDLPGQFSPANDRDDRAENPSWSIRFNAL
jgi:hypothetical protein